MNFTTSGASVSAWVNTLLLPSELPESFAGILDSSQDAYIMYLDRGNQELRVKFTTSDGVAERPGIPESMLQIEEWMHVAGVYDGDQQSASIYLNGELIDTHDNDGFGQSLASGQVASIGANAAADGTPGQRQYPSRQGCLWGCLSPYLCDAAEGRADPSATDGQSGCHTIEEVVSLISV